MTAIESTPRLPMDAHSHEEMDRKHFREEEHRKREQHAERFRKLDLNADQLGKFLIRYKGIKMEKPIADGHLHADAPPMGTDRISGDSRSIEGNEPLQPAKDMLFGVLSGDRSLNVRPNRTQRELPTLTIPRLKSDPLNVMKATAEHNARGPWQDPSGSADDLRAGRIIMEIESGEVENEPVGDGSVTALRLISHPEINEEILYGCMTNIEQSKLVPQKLMKIQ